MRALRLTGDYLGAGAAEGGRGEAGEGGAARMGAYVYPEWFHMQGESCSKVDEDGRGAGREGSW